MFLKLKPYSQNSYPLGALLIRGDKVSEWLNTLQGLALDWNQFEMYPIPDVEPNSLWGCFVKLHDVQDFAIGKFEWCQQVYPNFFIPELSILSPELLPEDHRVLASENIHVFHPEFGLVEVAKSLDLSEVFQLPTSTQAHIQQPKPGVIIANEVKRFQIKPRTEGDILDDFEGAVFGEKEGMSNDPLDVVDLGKLALYKGLFRKNENDGEKQTEKTGFMKGLESLFGGDDQNKSWPQNWQNDYEDLERRNQKQLDRLMDLLKKNPEEGLKYAIPIDDNSSSRGPDLGEGAWELSRLWGDFGLFGSSGFNGGSGGSINLEESRLEKLRRQYQETAESLVEKGDYKKVAFVYMKLLKDYYMAASTLRDGKLYEEAATMYLKYLKNEELAAQCYEEGKMIEKAIELYEELRNYEKVGDLHLSIGNHKEAMVFYQKVIDALVLEGKYLQASEIAENKTKDLTLTQRLLQDGWLQEKRGVTCLKRFLSNIKSLDDRLIELKQIHGTLQKRRCEEFLEVIYAEFKKGNELRSETKEMAYEIIAQHASKLPHLVENLKKYSEEDKEVARDVFRYKTGKRR